MKKLLLLIITLLISPNIYAQDFNTQLKLAEQGDAKAQFNVGVCYDTGNGVAKNDKKAYQWYLKSAEQRYADAQCLIGICYVVGIGVDTNLDTAYEWFEKSAEQGCEPAIDVINDYDAITAEMQNKFTR